MKNIVVVGGSSGIGLCLCQKLTESGDAVTCISTSVCPISKVKSIVADVTDFAALQAAFKGIDEIDAVFYCAGISLAAPVEYVERADLKRLIDINLVGAIDCCRLALPLLKKSSTGRIILLGSTGGVTPIAFDSFYSASKAGLIMFSKTLCAELPHNIKCTAAVIGGVRTRFSFKRKIYDCAGSEYEKNLARAADKLIKIEQTGYSPDFVADRLIKIMNSPSPSPVVSIGFTKKLITLFAKLAPAPLTVWLTKKIFNISDK